MSTTKHKAVKQDQKDQHQQQQKHQQQKTKQQPASKKAQASGMFQEHEHAEMRMTD